MSNYNVTGHLQTPADFKANREALESFADKCKQAWEEERARQEREAEARREKKKKIIIAEFMSRFGLAISPSDIADDIVSIGGLRLQAVISMSDGRMHGVQLSGVCPYCGQDCWSVPCWGLEDIGGQLELFSSDNCCD